MIRREDQLLNVNWARCEDGLLDRFKGVLGQRGSLGTTNGAMEEQHKQPSVHTPCSEHNTTQLAQLLLQPLCNPSLPSASLFLRFLRILPCLSPYSMCPTPVASCLLQRMLCYTGVERPLHTQPLLLKNNTGLNVPQLQNTCVGGCQTHLGDFFCFWRSRWRRALLKGAALSFCHSIAPLLRPLTSEQWHR